MTIMRILTYCNYFFKKSNSRDENMMNEKTTVPTARIIQQKEYL